MHRFAIRAGPAQSSTCRNFEVTMMFLRHALYGFVLFGIPCFADTMYVDKSAGFDCRDYDPVSRSCGSGNSIEFSTLDGGLDAARAGDVLYLRAGSYGQLDIRHSGLGDNPVTISGFAGETVVIDASGAVGIRVIDKSDVHIRNLTVSNVQGFGRIENSSGIVIDSVVFRNALASGTTGALKFVRSTRNRVLGSSFENGSDLLILQDDSNENVIQDNTFGRASHSLISVRCSSRNIIRENEFNNPDQKAVELYDCEGVSDAPVRLDNAKQNLVEKNRFYGTAASDRNYRFNAIQHGGQQTIVRFNVFTENLGGGSNYQHYSDESLHVYENRLYHNTFFNNRCHAIIGSDTTSGSFYDNRVVNNLLYRNTDCSGGNEQTDIRNPSLVILINNSVVDSDPGFVSTETKDFQLTTNSAQIDAGVFLAAATSTGNGRVIDVDEAGWFSDGFGIPGELGDVIQIEGGSSTARIASIDYESNVLTLVSALAWIEGDGVHLKFEGVAPDVGAFESTVIGKKPNPPEDFRAD
jgi:hypothetical protein